MKKIGGMLGRALAAGLSRVWVAWGRFRLLRGDAPRAAAVFERAARACPGAFAPWMHLARARLRDRDVFRARRALARAREEAPARFDAEAARWVRLEGYDLLTLSDLGARPEPASRHPAYLGVAGAAARASLPYGDCRDLDEYARFGAMPPIASSEWEDVDWDELTEDLQDG